MAKHNGQSLDIKEENIRKLKQLFPEIDTDGKIDFDMLCQILGEYVDDSDERYNFKWNGKGRALRFSQTPSKGTLRPCKEESKDWDDTQNLYIEGDNLEVLKILQKRYHGKIKMIYIDPPYNTGKDFVYPDNYHNSIKNYKYITRQVDEDGRSISTNTETDGQIHTKWLNMMYPSLRLARNLLADDRVIFISIDEHKFANIKKMGTAMGLDTVKSLQLIKQLLFHMGRNYTILDFFSGSATTAHAVMHLNAEDGGNRNFICVQLPEPTKEDSEARKAGYLNICEIGKERIRRAGEKIKNEIESGNNQLKLGEGAKKYLTSDLRFSSLTVQT